MQYNAFSKLVRKCYAYLKKLNRSSDFNQHKIDPAITKTGGRDGTKFNYFLFLHPIKAADLLPNWNHPKQWLHASGPYEWHVKQLSNIIL